MTLINVLLDTIERSPPAIDARIILMQQWINAGLLDAAEDSAKELLRVDPSNATAQTFLNSRQSSTKSNTRPSSTFGGQKSNPPRTEDRTPLRSGPLPQTSGERAQMERELSDGYEALRSRAKLLYQESRLVHDLQQREHITAEPDNQTQNLKAVVDGRMSAVVSARPPQSARALARAMEAEAEKALDIAVEDFAAMVRWLRASANSTNSALATDNDSLREMLMKRVRMLTAALPDELQQLPATALMHVEHEELERTYINDETMYMTPVAEIPRANFWVSEDGYAWDMDELAQSIASNGGVMRNPLSRQMFSPDDVRAIVQHPLGRQLEALQMEQSRLSKGVRPATVDRLDQLSSILLNDQSDDQVPSRQAIDDFLRYIVTLPSAEQRAIDNLRVPASDSHTGQPFDCTIGEAVRDGKANKICLHKTGDLIGQAARYLHQSNTT
jgi:hypothetical protein